MKILSNRKRVRVVIFDCDGVLFDSREANIAFYNSILSHFDKPAVKPDEGDMVHMCTAGECIDYFFRDDPRLQEAHQHRKDLSYDGFIPFMKEEPFLRDVLALLHSRYHLAIATNRTSSIHSILRDFDLTGFFDLVVCSLDVQRPKPDPETVWKILDHFGVSPGETVFVGDTIVDQKTAARSGVPFIAYRNPGLETAYKARSMPEVLGLISGSAVDKIASRKL